MSTAVQEGALITEHRKSKNTPLRCGWRFLRENLPAILILSGGPVLLATITDVFSYRYALAKHELLILFVLFFVAEAWLINAFSMLAIQRSRVGSEAPALVYGAPQTPPSLALRSLHLLPKVLLSYTLVRLLLIAAGLYPYLISVAFCFIWAPFFVAGEIFAKELPPRDPEDDYADDDEDSFGDYEERYFSGHALWQVGFGRSFVFAVANIGVTLELVTLYWAAKAAPVALVWSVFGVNRGPVEKFLEAFLPNLACSLVLALGAAAFYLLITRSARDELGLARLGDAELGARAQFRPSVFVLLVALPLAAGSSWYVFQSLKREMQMPSAAKIAIESLKTEDKNLSLRVQLVDPERQFRWLAPQNFRLVFAEPLSVEQKPAKDSEVALESNAETVPASSNKTRPVEVTPERVYVFNKAGKLLAEEYRPSYEPLTLEFRFRIPAGAKSSDDLVLRYRSFDRLSDASLRIPLKEENQTPKVLESKPETP